VSVFTKAEYDHLAGYAALTAKLKKITVNGTQYPAIFTGNVALDGKNCPMLYRVPSNQSEVGGKGEDSRTISSTWYVYGIGAGSLKEAEEIAELVKKRFLHNPFAVQGFVVGDVYVDGPADAGSDETQAALLLRVEYHADAAP
jgi:hypothetical protein